MMSVKSFDNISIDTSKIVGTKWIKGGSDLVSTHVVITLEGGATILLEGGERIPERKARAYNEFKKWWNRRGKWKRLRF